MEALVAAAAAQWSNSSWLAGATAVLAAVAGLILAYSGEAGPRGALGVVSEKRGWLLGLLLLEAAAGIATAALIVLLGITEPEWIDQTVGWLLVGLAGPAVAAAAILTISIGGKDVNIGLSLVYTPLRQWLLKPLDNGFHSAGRKFERSAEAFYRQRAEEAFQEDRLTLDGLIGELKSYAGRDTRSESEKAEITIQLAAIDRTTAPEDEARKKAWQLEEIFKLVAFIVSKRYFAVIEGDLGKLDRGQLKQFEPAAPPAGAIT